MREPSPRGLVELVERLQPVRAREVLRLVEEGGVDPYRTSTLLCTLITAGVIELDDDRRMTVVEDGPDEPSVSVQPTSRQEMRCRPWPSTPPGELAEALDALAEAFGGPGVIDGEPSFDFRQPTTGVVGDGELTRRISELLPPLSIRWAWAILVIMGLVAGALAGLSVAAEDFLIEAPVAFSACLGVLVLMATLVTWGRTNALYVDDIVALLDRCDRLEAAAREGSSRIGTAVECLRSDTDSEQVKRGALIDLMCVRTDLQDALVPPSPPKPLAVGDTVTREDADRARQIEAAALRLLDEMKPAAEGAWVSYEAIGALAIALLLEPSEGGES